jgi:hypothetical protein
LVAFSVVHAVLAREAQLEDRELRRESAHLASNGCVLWIFSEAFDRLLPAQHEIRIA